MHLTSLPESLKSLKGKTGNTGKNDEYLELEVISGMTNEDKKIPDKNTPGAFFLFCFF